MSSALTTAAWAANVADINERTVLLALADRANKQGECWPAVKDLMVRAILSERKVRGVLKQLEAAGHIERRHRPGKATVYIIHPCTECTPSTAPCAPPERLQTPAQRAPTPAQRAPSGAPCAPTPARGAPPFLNLSRNLPLTVQESSTAERGGDRFIKTASEKKPPSRTKTPKAEKDPESARIERARELYRKQPDFPVSTAAKMFDLAIDTIMRLISPGPNAEPNGAAT